MRIGKFAGLNQLSIDTIRYYMELGLILPEKSGGQYDFDEKSQRALEEVLALKNLGFSLHEIKNIFLIQSLGKQTPYEEDGYYQAFFYNKLRNIKDEINKLNEMQTKLEAKLKVLSRQTKNNRHKIGINFKALQLFRCLKCQGELILSDGNIIDNQVIDGRLRCSCGEEYIIEAGILRVENLKREGQFHDEYSPEFIKDYVSLTHVAFLDNLYRGLEWIDQKVDFSSYKGKTLLELGSGTGFFLRYIYESLPEDCLYIAVDHDINKHIFVKNMLEKAHCKRNIIFICSDFLSVPIKKHSVDVLMDFSGTTNYSFESSDFLLDLVNDYTKDKTILLGTYILFKNFSSRSMVEEKYRKNFILQNIREGIDKLDFRVIEDRVSDYIDEGGQFEDFFVKGEEIYTYIVYGERLG